MPLSTWKLYLYSASADSVTTAYDTISTTTLSGLSGYATTNVYITKPHTMWEFENAMLEDISGARRGTSARRRIWEVVTYPFAYANGLGSQDLDDIDTLANVIDANAYLWARIEGGGRTWPSTASTAHPVLLMDWQEAINDAAGTRTVTLSLAHRYRY